MLLLFFCFHLTESENGKGEIALEITALFIVIGKFHCL